MDLSLTADQEAVVDAVTRLLRERCGVDDVRRAEQAGGFDAGVWQAMVEMGLPAMAAPAPAGGAASVLDAQLVCEQAGRFLAAVPLPQCLAAARLLATGAPEWVERVAAGEIVAIAPEPTAPVPFLPEAVAVLVRSDAGWLLGTEPRARRARSTSFESAGFLEGAGDQRLVPAEARSSLHAFEAARLVGLAGRALDLAVAHVVDRRQFDRPIGSFQAVQHRLADVATEVEAARLLVLEAGWAIDQGGAGPSPIAAYAMAAAVARHAAAEAVQLHGGYGFMLEYEAQMHLRRARSWGAWLGAPDASWSSVADELFGTVA